MLSPDDTGEDELSDAPRGSGPGAFRVVTTILDRDWWW
jgi:hypothetical protein